MRVLLVVTTLDAGSGGGVTQKTLQLARALTAQGDEVRILTTTSVAGAGMGIETIAVPLLNRRYWIPAPLRNRISRGVAWSDIVVLNNHWQLLNVLAARAARRRGRPWAVIPSGALRAFGRSLFAKRIFNLLGGTRVVRDAAVHIATTTDEIAEFASYGVAADRVITIPNAIQVAVPAEESGPDFRRLYGLGDAPILLFAGRLAGVKGPDLLLEAFGRIAGEIPHQLVFAGADEGLLHSLRALARSAGVVERVRFLGFVPATQKAAMFDAAHVVVIPSRKEAGSLVLLEAGLAAKPVLVTDQCGVGHLAEMGLVHSTQADAASLAAAIRAILDAQDRSRMGAALRDYILANHGWDVVTEKYRDAFHRAVGRVRAPRG